MNFSVIIPNLNSPIIDQTVGSLEQQDYDTDDFEVIVVGIDDFGLISESELVKTIFTQKPLSPAMARNRGAEEALGEVIVFLDADCIALPNWLSTIADRFSSPDIHVVGGGVDFKLFNYWSVADNLSMFYDNLSIHSPGLRSQLPSLNLAMRRSAFDNVGGFDERYPRPSGEDADLTIRLKKLGYYLYFEPRAVIIHTPTRNRFIDMLRHSFYQGKYSTKVDPRYIKLEGLPWPFHTRLGVTLFSPLLAAGAILRIFSSNKNLLKYWYAIPAIYLSKLSWCVGAATHPTFE